jgi:hypothetical protein
MSDGMTREKVASALAEEIRHGETSEAISRVANWRNPSQWNVNMKRAIVEATNKLNGIVYAGTQTPLTAEAILFGTIFAHYPDRISDLPF